MTNQTNGTVSYKFAAMRISRCERTVRRLVRAGRLESVGQGQKRMVTLRSLELYLADEKKGRTCTEKMADIRLDNVRGEGVPRNMEQPQAAPELSPEIIAAIKLCAVLPT